MPTMGYKGFDEEIGKHFGRAPTYTIIDTNNDIISIIENTNEHTGRMSLLAEILAKYEVDAIICSGLERRAIMLFNQCRIKVFTGAQGTVRNTYNLWRDNKLQEVGSVNDVFKVYTFGSHEHTHSIGHS